MELLILPEHDRGARENCCGEVEAKGRDIVCEGEEFQQVAVMRDPEEDCACLGEMEKGSEGGVFWGLGGRVARWVGGEGGLGGEDRDGLCGWEEG